VSPDSTVEQVERRSAAGDGPGTPHGRVMPSAGVGEASGNATPEGDPAVIPTASMAPTLRAGDRVLVSRIDYRVGDVHRGDVIVFAGDGVFDPPRSQPSSLLARAGDAFASALGVPVGEHDYTKRVIGLGGDHVICCDVAGRLTVNGVPLAEPYLPTGLDASLVRFDIVVPIGRLWVMGDNRRVSADSRAHLGDPGGGTVPLDHVVGRVVAVWWPLRRATGIGAGGAPHVTLPASSTPLGIGGRRRE
jgi:signal peptidase I